MQLEIGPGDGGVERVWVGVGEDTLQGRVGDEGSDAADFGFDEMAAEAPAGDGWARIGERVEWKSGVRGWGMRNALLEKKCPRASPRRR